MKANRFFFLSAVAPHINADVVLDGNTTLIAFTHEDDKHKDDRLIVEVKRENNEYTVGYDMISLAGIVQQSQSTAIPSRLVYGVIAELANDAFKVQK